MIKAYFLDLYGEPVSDYEGAANEIVIHKEPLLVHPSCAREKLFDGVVPTTMKLLYRTEEIYIPFNNDVFESMKASNPHYYPKRVKSFSEPYIQKDNWVVDLGLEQVVSYVEAESLDELLTIFPDHVLKKNYTWHGVVFEYALIDLEW